MAATPLRTIVIVGGGFCGTVLATMLLRRPHAGPTRLVVVERGPHIGRGVAFAQRDHPYLLNVPTGRMSANPDDPLEFLRFVQRREPDVDAESFVPRALYGDYLEESLLAAQLAAPGNVRLDVIRASVTALHRRRRDLPIRLALDSGAELHADAVVLAVGNPPPRRLAVADALAAHPAYVEDPWTMPADAGAGERLFLIGTGLTMVDVALAAAARSSGGSLHALSRHGLVGSRQAAFRPDALRGSGEAVMLAAAPSPRRMLRAVRSLARDAQAEGGDWREAINFVRSVAPDLWRRMSTADRAQFLRHVRPYWDVHRHRLPEAALTLITHLRRTGRLQVHAGRLESLEPRADGVAVHWRPRGQDTRRHAVVDRVVNCTGPDYDLTRTRDPLLQSLVRDKLAVPDALGLGLRTGREGAVIDADGWPCTNLFYLGPMLRADHWEATAAAELASHAARLTAHLQEMAQSRFSETGGSASRPTFEKQA
jgi:uncharacterized NAD(P)/FAD-binding protein YdhS